MEERREDGEKGEKSAGRRNARRGGEIQGR